jgi:flagellar motor component MotA
VNQKKIGHLIQAAGVVAAVVGVVAGLHHLAFSVPVVAGAVAWFAGKKVADGGL